MATRIDKNQWFDENGNLIREEEVEVEIFEESGIEYFQNLPPEQSKAILQIAAGMVEKAGDIWNGAYAMSDDNDAKGPIRVIADVALEAALPLLES